MYSTVVRHLYSLQSDLPSKSHTHLTPYTVITVLLTLFPYCDCFVTANLCFLIPRPLSPILPAPAPPTWQASVCSLCLPWSCLPWSCLRVTSDVLFGLLQSGSPSIEPLRAASQCCQQPPLARPHGCSSDLVLPLVG